MRSQRSDDGRAAIGFQWRNVHTRLTRRRPPRKIVSGKKHETHSVFRRQHASTDRTRKGFTSSTRVRSDRNRYIYSPTRFPRSTISNDRASRKTYNIVIIIIPITDYSSTTTTAPPRPICSFETRCQWTGWIKRRAFCAVLFKVTFYDVIPAVLYPWFVNA